MKRDGIPGTTSALRSRTMSYLGQFTRAGLVATSYTWQPIRVSLSYPRQCRCCGLAGQDLPLCRRCIVVVIPNKPTCPVIYDGSKQNFLTKPLALRLTSVQPVSKIVRSVLLHPNPMSSLAPWHTYDVGAWFTRLNHHLSLRCRWWPESQCFLHVFHEECNCQTLVLARLLSHLARA